MSLTTEREAQAREELGHTAVRPGVAKLLVGLFLLTLVAEPIARLAGAGDEAPLAPPPSPAALGRTLVNDGWLAAHRRLGRWMDGFEEAMEEGSALRAAALPGAQWLLSAAGGVGNEKVDLGREGWLFFHPGVGYLTGPGFLSDEDVAADPAEVVADFADQLTGRGVELLLVPLPTKAMVVPERLSARRIDPTALQNPSWEAFRERLAGRGVEVLDPTPALLALEQAGTGAFLRTDSHWSPAGVEVVAAEIAIRAGEILGPPATPFEIESREAVQEGFGDLARLLRLPAGSRLIAEERIRVSQAQAPVGGPAAEVLLLGDSFTNVYASEDLGWGTGAGLAEQLALRLGRPVDRLALNDGGATGVRRDLAQRLARGDDRLAGKRLVVWQLAMRDLAVGEWEAVALPEAGRAPTPPQAGTLRIRATLAARPEIPGDTPYRDLVIGLHLTGIEVLAGELAEPEILAYAWARRDDHPTPAAAWQPGARLELDLRPWTEVADTYGAYQRLEPEGDALFLDAYWIASAEP